MNSWGGKAAAALTAAVLRRDSYRCHWCGGRADSADHYPVARADGGPDTLSNLVAACLPCNKSKGTGPRPRRTITAPPSRNWTGSAA